MRNVLKEDHMNDNICTYERCGRIFRTKAGLVIHKKRLHRTMENATAFRCQKCNSEKECRICNNLVGRTNYARHVKSCKQRNNLQEERAAQVRSDQTNAPTARKHVSKRTECTYCDADVTATNLARNQRSKACMALDQ